MPWTEHLATMDNGSALVEGLVTDVPAPVADFQRVLGASATIGSLDRFAFYERARNAFAVVRTGEMRPYGNAILVKGVVNE